MADEHSTGDLSPERAGAREQVIEALARSLEVYGAKRSYGRLYGILYFATGPVSLDVLVERSGYAKSTVSTAMNTLERFHLVQRRSLQGEGKKAFFEAEEDFWYVFQQFLREQVRREIQIMSRALDEAEATLEAADDPGAQADLERVRQLQRIYDEGDRIIDLLTSEDLEEVASLLEEPPEER